VAVKACTVIVKDAAHTTHAVEVTAETLYEAVAQALAAMRGQPWAAQIAAGSATATVRVRQPEVTHVVKLREFEAWLNRSPRSPAEMTLKTRLRHIVNGDSR
jgi:hypothetical protein